MIAYNFNIDETMSLYIPHVFPNFDESYIAGVFEWLDFGAVSHVDLVAKMDHCGNVYNAAFVHFESWTDSSMVENFQCRVKDTERDARIIHDDPWFWIILENKAKKHIPGQRKQCINIVGTDDGEEGEEEGLECEDLGLEEGEDHDHDFSIGRKNVDYDSWKEDLWQENENNKNTIIMLRAENEKLRLDLEIERFVSASLQQDLDELHNVF
jgi:hypothetical protein